MPPTVAPPSLMASRLPKAPEMRREDMALCSARMAGLPFCRGTGGAAQISGQRRIQGTQWPALLPAVRPSASASAVNASAASVAGISRPIAETRCAAYAAEESAIKPRNAELLTHLSTPRARFQLQLRPNPHPSTSTTSPGCPAPPWRSPVTRHRARKKPRRSLPPTAIWRLSCTTLFVRRGGVPVQRP